jgi:hypothetical protein
LVLGGTGVIGFVSTELAAVHDGVLSSVGFGSGDR